MEFTREQVFPWMVAAGYVQQFDSSTNARKETIRTPSDRFAITIDGVDIEAKVDVDRDWDHGVHMWQWARCTNQKYIRFHDMNEASFVEAIREMEQKIISENSSSAR